MKKTEAWALQHVETKRVHSDTVRTMKRTVVADYWRTVKNGNYKPVKVWIVPQVRK